ncbi:MAG: GTP-binding protein [Clostridia bacterium]|nr:GTP-binding protein [Clostridia bacterium]
MDTQQNRREHMNIVIVGHVDHGKSTVIGRLLADTGALPQGKLEQIREMCRRNDKPFEYAFLLDALKDERSQGITIDTARCFFHTKKRQYIIIDAPGHIEFLKNMITGASRAAAALLVIDAHEGVQENSRRHGYMLAMLGIRQICVMVNKMDLVDYDRAVYERIEAQYSDFLKEIGVAPEGFIPVSAREGDNIARRSGRMPWYAGPTVLDMLDEFHTPGSLENLPLRMPVQDVYKFTHGDSRRIIAGTVETGTLRAGDEVVFYPSGKRTRVNRVEPMRSDEAEGVASAGYAAGFTMTEQIYVRRGELCARAGETPPKVASRMRASLFWLGRAPMVPGKTYFLKTGSAKVECRLEKILSVMDASSLHRVEKREVDRHEVAECVLAASKLVAFDDTGDLAATNRFVIVDDYEISGGGIFSEALPEAEDAHAAGRCAWQTGDVSPAERARLLGQRPRMLLLSGPDAEALRETAAALERRLLEAGRPAYYLGVAPSAGPGERAATLAELPERARLLMNAGALVIATAVDLTPEEEDALRMHVSSDRIEARWLGGACPLDWPVLPAGGAAEAVWAQWAAD